MKISVVAINSQFVHMHSILKRFYTLIILFSQSLTVLPNFVVVKFTNVRNVSNRRNLNTFFSVGT